MRCPRSIFIAFSLCLLIVPGFLGLAAAQQPQEKRIALVVGDGNYQKAPLATAANDAGLIAQTLQAAGFDVIGARDLDADGLRNSFRDFIAKVQASPADTVAMIYLSGYAVQLAGENYFIPVDAKISRDTDIPIEGLRISDYTRQLASIPVRASVVVLDAARQQPFIEGGNPIAGGLALVEPSPNMLIAFNAAPGTVAPNDTGNYGVYAQSLAEMIRTGGLSLPDVFDRLRLRVSEASKGAQIPWDEQKIQTQFSFFDRAPDAPPVQGSPEQVAAIRNRPIRDLGAHDAYTAALARDTLQGYEDFVAAYPSDRLARRVRAILAARREAIIWRRTYLADTPDAYWSYLRRYPQGPHAWDARRRLEILSAALEPPQSFAMMDYDIPPPPPDEYVYVDRPVFYFSDPEFDFAPPPPPPVYYLPPPPPDFVVLAPPILAVGLFLLPRPVFVPMPVYCEPPAYIAPPPNNIIYNNIHNTTIINTVINNPAPPPAAVAAAGGPRGGTLAPPLPAAVSQRATLIEQGKLPPPPAASVRPGVAPTALAPNAVPNAAPNAPRQELPKNNVLPMPGRGAPPAPPMPPQGAVAPNAPPTTPAEQGRHNLPNVTPPTANAPGANPPAVNPPSAGGKPAPTTPAEQGRHNLPNVTPPTANAPGANPPVANQPGAGAKPSPTTPGRPPVVQNQTTPPPAAQEHRGTPQPGATAPTPSGPTPQVGRGQPSPPPSRAAPPPPPSRAAPPPPPSRPQPAARPSPPPMRAAPPPPPPRAAAPPPPRPQPAMRPSPPPMRAAPPPPPPRMAAPPPPPMRAAPPPPPRMAAPPPPQMRAPPPPPPRMAAPPPPPRPAAPPPQRAPPPQARCQPNQPNCR